MGESKYFEQLSKLIEDTINCTQENLPDLKKSAKKCLDDIYIFLNKNKELNKIESKKNQSENIFSNYFIRNLRLKYQLEITKNISNENKIISIGKITCEFIFWIINESKIISLQQIIKFLQDIVETIPLSGLEDIFNIVSESLKNLENSLIHEIKLDILFLQNLFLKRINNNINDKLKGKIFLLFCDLFSIEEVSGANKNGKYSKNQLNEELSNYSNDNSDTIINDEDAKMGIEEKNDEKNKSDVDKDKNNIESTTKIDEKKENQEKKEKNKMVVEEEIKNDDKKEIKSEIKENKESKENKEIDEDKNNNDSEITISKEQNEKIKFYEQFWIIQKILIIPFKVCKQLYNLYNNKIFYFIAI